MPAVTVAAKMDTLITSCSSDVWQIILNKPIECSSVAADGSDFIITGTSPVIVQSASADCNNGAGNVVLLKLATPAAFGNYQVKLVNGSDRNTLIDECDQPIAAGASLITTINNCNISVPSGFTPNGDGINDYLYPLNASDAGNLEFHVYNRYGYLVFEKKNRQKNGMVLLMAYCSKKEHISGHLNTQIKPLAKTFF